MLVAGTVFIGMAYLFYLYIDGMNPQKIPLPKEAEEISRHPNVHPKKIDDISFDKELRLRTVPLLEKGLYSEAVRESALALFDIIREKSGVLDDAGSLIRTVFRGNTPVLKFMDIAPEHIRNPEQGIISYLDGFAQFTRKIHMHASVSITKEEAILKVSLAAWLAERVKLDSEVNHSN